MKPLTRETTIDWFFYTLGWCGLGTAIGLILSGHPWYFLAVLLNAFSIHLHLGLLEVKDK